MPFSLAVKTLSTSLKDSERVLFRCLLHSNKRCTFATTATDIARLRKEQVPHVPLSQVSFTNAQDIFTTVRTSELIKQGLLLSSMRLRPLFQNAGFLLNLTQKVFGKTLTMFAVRYTLFQHFCGGEDLAGLMKTGEQLAMRNLGTIVDYAAESEDVDDKGPSHTWLDNNLKLTKDGILHSAKLRDAQGYDYAFLALKISSMCRPQLCRKFTACLNILHSLYGYGVNVITSPTYYSPMQHELLMKKHLAKNDALTLLKTLWSSLTEEQVESMFTEMCSLPKLIDQEHISYIQWMAYFTPERISSLASPIIPSDPVMTKTLSEQYWFKATTDLVEWQETYARIEQCFKLAQQLNVRLLVDAEQTYFQSAIDWFAIDAMEKYSKVEGQQSIEATPAVSYNTYQLYLKNSLGKLKYDAARADALGYKFGVKAVRGAYLTQEKKCAKQFNYENPVHDCVEDTHAAFDQGVEFLMKRLPQTEILCGSHNERSITKFARMLGQITDNQPKKYPMSFGQLLGMCDYISLQLGKTGARSYKYVPYGSIHLVLPYLMRRAEENSSIFGEAAKEARLIWKEVNRRVLTSLGVI